MLKKDPSISIHPKPTVSIHGTGPGTMPWVMRGTARPATWTTDMKTMSTSCPDTEDGYITPLTGKISGSLIVWGATGALITTAVGYGHLITVMCGRHMIPGVTLHIITADGIGTFIMAGTGTPVITGRPVGFTGSETATITDGVR
jgi:hypothetical protein